MKLSLDHTDSWFPFNFWCVKKWITEIKLTEDYFDMLYYDIILK